MNDELLGLSPIHNLHAIHKTLFWLTWRGNNSHCLHDRLLKVHRCQTNTKLKTANKSARVSEISLSCTFCRCYILYFSNFSCIFTSRNRCENNLIINMWFCCSKKMIGWYWPFRVCLNLFIIKHKKYVHKFNKSIVCNSQTNVLTLQFYFEMTWC